MPRVNLRRIDLNLLTVFEVVYEERNQRKASERLFLTQPAISSAISRLREITQDRLFQNTPRGLIPTARADELYAGLRMALDQIRAELDSSDQFIAANSQRVFKLAVEYGSGAALILPLFKALRAEAPLSRLQIQSINEGEQAIESLKKGEIDLLISQRRFLEIGIDSEVFNLHQGVVVARENHPRIHKVPTLDTLMGEQFVLVHGQPMAYENKALDELVHCIKDLVVLEVPTAVLIPQIVRHTDLVSVISLQTLQAVEGAHGLQVFDLPAQGARANAYVHWQEQTDSGGQWFRAFALHHLPLILDVSDGEPNCLA